jgi:NAD(P)-dependent dehydrogenase (short-subunit alcohol dehydrogenase family)
MTERDGRCAVVTGAASGIGRATARLLGAEGAAVVVADLDEAGARATARAIVDAGGQAHHFTADVSSTNDVAALMDAAVELMGRLTTIVNIAGAQRSGPVTEFSDQDWDLMMDVNAKSCFLAARHGVPHLPRDGTAAIVNVSSLGALKGYAGVTAYSASKGAVVSFTRCLAVELGPCGIRVNCVCPGWVDTPFNEPVIAVMGGREAQDTLLRETVPLGRQATPEELAPTIAHLTSCGAAYVSGAVIVVDGGLGAA